MKASDLKAFLTTSDATAKELCTFTPLIPLLYNTTQTSAIHCEGPAPSLTLHKEKKNVKIKLGNINRPIKS